MSRPNRRAPGPNDRSNRGGSGGSGGSDDGGGGQGRDVEAEALDLEASVRSASDEDQAAALVAAAPEAVVEEAEELETEEAAEEFEERRSAAKGRGKDRAKGPKVPKNSVNVFRRLYRGQTSFDFVGRRRRWFAVSGAIILAGMLALGFRGLNLGIDFKGGTAWEVASHGVTPAAATTAVEKAGLSEPTVEILGSKTLEIQYDLSSLSPTQRTSEIAKVSNALGRLTHTQSTGVSIETVGPTWGGQITQRAIEALIAFFVLVAIYISFRFEPKMAIAAFVALVHDLLVTVGVYALFGFQVTPDTVIAVLTILGYSLYDTVVVFDRVRDNSMNFGSSGRMTYSEMVNLSMNQTLARSINTSLVAILPVLSVLLVGADLLGAVTLQNYGLALFVGLMSGAYSSIFIASPILAILKEREPRYATIRHRLESRGERVGLLTPAAAAMMAGAGASGGSIRTGAGGQRRAPAGRSGTLRPGGASQTGRRANAGAKGAARVGAGPGTPGAKGAGAGSSAQAPGSGAAKGTTGVGGSAARATSATKRPTARPRKGGSKGGSKGKKRR